MKSLKINLVVITSLLISSISCKKETEDKVVEPDPIVTPVLNTVSSNKVNVIGTQFSTLYDHQSVSFNNKLWVIGGRSGSSSKNEIWTSSDGSTWTQTTVNGNYFNSINGHQLVVFNNKLWVIGGVNNGAGIVDIWSSVDGINWTQEASSTSFSPRYNHEVVVFKDKLWLIGGDAGGVKSDVWSSADGINWTQETTVGNQFSARGGHKVVVINDKMILIGGYTTTGFVNDVWATSDGINWLEQTTTGTKFSPMYGHEATVFNGKIYVIAGQTGAWGTTTDEVWISSNNGKDWVKQTISGTSFGGRAAHQAAVFNSKIYIIGGYDSAAAEKNDIWTIN